MNAVNALQMQINEKYILILDNNKVNLNLIEINNLHIK